MVFFSGANPVYITCMNIMYISAMDLVPDPEFLNWTDPDPNE